MPSRRRWVLTRDFLGFPARRLTAPGFFLAGVRPPASVAARAANQTTSVSLRRLIQLLGLCLLPVPTLAAPPELYPGLGRKWQHYQSPNFELYSANSDRESRDVLEKMELLRALFLDTFQFKVRMPQPVTIYYFDRQADFEGYTSARFRGGTAKYAGFCTNFEDRTVITLAPARSHEAATRVIYHEYIHYLFRITEQNPAPWFNEGVAELFSTLAEDGEWLRLGDPVAGRVLELHNGRMMPFDQLFATGYDSPVFKDSGHSGMFYAQSWAFLHYCRFGVNKIPKDKMALFLRVAGSPEIQARPADFRSVCRELLGLDYPGLLKEMERYISSGKFRGGKVRRPAIAPRSGYQARPADKEEMQRRLAELALRQTGNAYANLFMRELIGREPSSALHELMGTIAMQNDNVDLAREHWREAVRLGTVNAAIFRELGRIEANAVFSQFDLDYHMPEKRAAELRQLLRKSIECAPDQSAGYEMLAWVEAMSMDPDIATLNRVQERFAGLNDRARTLLALVIVRMRLGQRDAALALLAQMENTKPSDWARFCAELTRARLENRPVDREKLPQSMTFQPGMRISPPMVTPPR